MASIRQKEGGQVFVLNEEHDLMGLQFFSTIFLLTRLSPGRHAYKFLNFFWL
jgi:hypothetical protein